MRTSIAVVALLVLASVSQLSAQDGRSSSGGNPPMGSTPSKPLGVGEKIPPHAQPKATDLPPTASSYDQISAEDKALDRKLKGICRGC